MKPPPCWWLPRCCWSGSSAISLRLVWDTALSLRPYSGHSRGSHTVRQGLGKKRTGLHQQRGQGDGIVQARPGQRSINTSAFATRLKCPPKNPLGRCTHQGGFLVDITKEEAPSLVKTSTENNILRPNPSSSPNKTPAGTAPVGVV